MLSRIRLFVAARTVALQVPLSVGFSWHKSWIVLQFPSPGDLPWPRDRIPVSCVSCIGRWILYHWATWVALAPKASGNGGNWQVGEGTSSGQEGATGLGLRGCGGMLEGEGQGNRWEEVRMDQRGALKEEGGDSAGTGWGEPPGWRVHTWQVAFCPSCSLQSLLSWAQTRKKLLPQIHHACLLAAVSLMFPSPRRRTELSASVF